MFTKKHFNHLVDSLKLIDDIEGRRREATKWADIFEDDNPRFNREKFLNAAEVPTFFEMGYHDGLHNRKDFENASKESQESREEYLCGINDGISDRETNYLTFFRSIPKLDRQVLYTATYRYWDHLRTVANSGDYEDAMNTLFSILEQLKTARKSNG